MESKFPNVLSILASCGKSKCRALLATGWVYSVLLSMFLKSTFDALLQNRALQEIQTEEVEGPGNDSPLPQNTLALEHEWPGKSHRVEQ